MKTHPRSLQAFFQPALVLLCGALLLTACPSAPDLVTHNDIASLKAAHLSFVDQFTEGAGKTWDDQKLTAATAAMEKKFADAEQYAATKKDAHRTKALANLHSQFKRDADMLAKKKAFFRPAFATDLKAEISQNYDQALKGEENRS